MIGIGLRIGLFGSGSIDAQAQAHYNRVIADGGVVPAGVSGTNAFFNAVKTIYATSDITTAVSVGVDAHYLGYKMGAGAGATSGQAVQKLYSCAGSSGDVVQTTAASQPLLLAHNGASSDNYWYSPRVTGNFVSSPNATVNQISGNIEIIIRYQSNTSGIVQTLLMKGNTTSYNYAFDISNTNNLRFIFGGFEVISSSAAVNPLTLQYYKVTRNSSTGSVQFFTSSDGITYTQLGTTQSSTSGNLPTNTVQLVIGDNTAFTGNGSQGNIYRATIANSIGGTPVVDFNPSTYNASTSQTQWTSTTGEVWTINTGTASTGYKGVLVDRTIVQGDGVDDRLTSGTLTSRQYFTRYAVLNYLTGQFSEYIISGNPTETHLIYFAINLLFYNTANEITVSGATANNLQLITGDYNGITSKVRRNNSSDVTGVTGPATSTIVNLFTSGAGGSQSNSIISTLIDITSVSNNTQKSAMYNYIRSINNNAF